MRLEEIKGIKNIRNFLNFNGTTVFLNKKSNKQEVFDFFNKTIIYAPNGTGKTNLSRIFYYLSDKTRSIEDLLSLETRSNNEKLSFSFCIDGKIINEQNFNTDENRNILNNFYIFNSDYIEENIKCINFSNKNINGEISIPIGKENINVQLLKSSIDQKKGNRENHKNKLSNSLEKIKNKLKSNKYKGNDISIWQEFNLDKIIDEKYGITEPTKEKEFDSCEENFLKIKNFNSSDKIQSKLTEISETRTNELNAVFSILEDKKVFNVFNKKIENEISIITKNWIDQEILKKGINQSEEYKRCLLCGREINSSVAMLFKEYNSYFENEKGKFEARIGQFKNSLDLLKTDLQKINNNLQSKTEDLTKIFSSKKIWLDLSTDTLINKVENFKKILDLKKDNPQEIPKFKKDIKSKIEELNERIKNNRDIFAEINKKIDDSKEVETKLRKTIGKKYLYNLYIDNKNVFQDIISSNQDICVEEIKLKNEFDKLPKKDKLTNIVDLFNIFMHDFIGLDKYTATKINSSISLCLKNVDISNETKKISEGEKTIIGLCYFLATSIQRFDSPEKYKDSIFIIDDPICSTSYGNFFGVCNLLDEFESKIFIKLWSREEKPKMQKILLTHNTQFFNMLRNNTFKENALYFLLSEDGFKIIQNKQLVSEFEIALYRLYEASKDSNYNGSIGNDMRRFFETVRHFYGLHQFEADSLKSIFTGFEENIHKEFYSAVNYYSHGNPEANTDPLPPENMSNLLKEFVFLIEKSQFKDLWENVKKLAN